MRLLSTSIYPLQGTNLQYFHLATIEHNFREFLCFIHTVSQRVFIEEISGGHLIAIEEDNLFNDLEIHCKVHKVTDVANITTKISEWKIKNGEAIEHER